MLNIPPTITVSVCYYINQLSSGLQVSGLGIFLQCRKCIILVITQVLVRRVLTYQAKHSCLCYMQIHNTLHMCSIHTNVLALLSFSPLLLFQQYSSNKMNTIKSIAPHSPPNTPPTMAPVLLSLPLADPPVEHAIRLLVRTVYTCILNFKLHYIYRRSGKFRC